MRARRWCITCVGMIGGHIVLTWLNHLVNRQVHDRFRAIRRFIGGGVAARGSAAKIRRERETFRRWSRRSIEDRFTL